jgi:hypothetical protein
MNLTRRNGHGTARLNSSCLGGLSADVNGLQQSSTRQFCSCRKGRCIGGASVFAECGGGIRRSGVAAASNCITRGRTDGVVRDHTHVRTPVDASLRKHRFSSVNGITRSSTPPACAPTRRGPEQHLGQCRGQAHQNANIPVHRPPYATATSSSCCALRNARIRLRLRSSIGKPNGHLGRH